MGVMGVPRWLVFGLVGCGRVAFDPLGATSDGAVSDAFVFELGTIVLDGPGADWVRRAADLPDGGFVLVGSIGADKAFGNATLTFAGMVDAVVLTLDAAGNPVTAWSIASPGFETASGVTADAAGNIYVVGTASNSIDFGKGVQVPQFDDAYVASYTPVGALRWAHLLGGNVTGGARDAAFTAVVHGSSLIVGGGVSGDVDFGGGTTPAASANSYRDGFVAAYDAATGAYQWAERFGDTGSSAVYELASDGTDLFFAADFGGSPTVFGTQVTSEGSSDIVVASLTSAGARRWVKSFGSTSNDSNPAMAVSPAGDVFVTGRFTGAMNPGTPLDIDGASDGYVVAYDRDGVFRWAHALGASTCASLHAGHVLADGTVVVGGQFSPSLDLDGTVLTASVANDGVIAGFAPTGELRWAERFGGTGDDCTFAIAGSARGRLLVAGAVNSELRADCSGVDSRGERDLFIGGF